MGGIPHTGFLRSCIPMLLLLLLVGQKATPQKKTRIDILYADELLFDKKMGESIKKLIGNVQLQHDEVIMACDSAYLYDNDRVVQAYGMIHMQQGDTLHLYGESVRYDANIKKAEVRKNVRLIDGESVVETQFLDFDVQNNLGYYFNGGEIRNGENILKSERGYYYTQPEIFFYREKVSIVNPDYTITCDSLDYHTKTEVSYFRSPTEIVGEDYYVFCRDGWYNMETDVARFITDAVVVNGSRTVRGDTIFYDRGRGYGNIISHAEIHDTTEMIILRGNHAEYYENPEWTMITDSALFIQYSDGDSLYLHADTLRSVTDTVSGYRMIRAYYGVRFFKDDLQGICDSMFYSFADSIIYLYRSPVIWSEENQLTADSMRIYTIRRKIDRLEMYRSSFIISQEDPGKYNQIRGKNMTGFFREGRLYRIDVFGNGQTIYFVRDGEEIVGVNRVESSDIRIFVKDNKIERIRLLTMPDGILNPPGETPPEELKLKGFAWYDDIRPRDKNDVHRRSPIQAIVRDEER